MSTNHTPGPWSVEVDDGRTYITGGSSQLAIVLWPHCGTPQRNAKLISTSPDLLAFAELIARMTTDEEMGGEMLGDDAVSTLSELIETARTLRNKAKGLT